MLINESKELLKGNRMSKVDADVFAEQSRAYLVVNDIDIIKEDKNMSVFIF